MLSNRSINPNSVHPPGSGTTALHLAASLARANIVTLLLDQEGIDDTLRDALGKSCKDVARGKEVVAAIRGKSDEVRLISRLIVCISDSRNLLEVKFLSVLRSYVLSPPTAATPVELLSLLESPRVRFLDLSLLDTDTGTTLLHEAAKRKDLRLVELAIRAGADVFARDRKGRTINEVAGKDDRVKVFLRQC